MFSGRMERFSGIGFLRFNGLFGFEIQAFKGKIRKFSN
jgi:hypothetical protein